MFLLAILLDMATQIGFGHTRVIGKFLCIPFDDDLANDPRVAEAYLGGHVQEDG